MLSEVISNYLPFSIPLIIFVTFIVFILCFIRYIKTNDPIRRKQLFRKGIILICIPIFLLILSIIFSAVFDMKVAPEDTVCEENADCVPVLPECGVCPSNYSAAVNKQFSDKYWQIYQNKCKDNTQICERILSGGSKCENK